MKIYAVKISDIPDEKLKKLCSFIDSEKRHRIEKFFNKEDKMRTLIGDLLIRTIITEKFKIRNKQITFMKGLYGKPYMGEYPELNFNISHSGDFVICAVDSRPVGIDIEKVKYIEYEDIAENFFTISEFYYITKNDSEGCLYKFYELWALKESYIKCSGQGLQVSFKSFSINIDNNGNISMTAGNGINEYIFKRFDIISDYKIAVCSLNREIPDNIIMLDQNDLIKKYL